MAKFGRSVFIDFIMLAVLSAATATLVDERKEPYCELCKKVVYLVKDFVNLNMTENDIKSILVSTCQNLGVDDSECLEETYLFSNTLHNILSKGVDPSEACRAIQLCVGGITPKFDKRGAAITESFVEPLSGVTPDDTVTHMGKVKEPTTRHLSKRFIFRRGGLCKACEKLLSSVDEALVTREGDIMNLLAEVCANLGFGLNHFCRKIVQQHSGSIIAHLERALEPSEVCRKIRVCRH